MGRDCGEDHALGVAKLRQIVAACYNHHACVRCDNMVQTEAFDAANLPQI
jgi:hypothetical protein